MNGEDAARLLALARGADLAGPEAASWVERLGPMRADLADATRYFVEAGQEDSAVELAAAVWRLWFRAGDLSGGRQMLAEVLDRGSKTPSHFRALALYGSGLLAFRAGAMEESQARNAEALQVAHAAGDRETETLALVGLSRVALRDHNYPLVRSLASRARELAVGLPPAASVLPVHLLAAGTRLAGDYDAAYPLYSESLQLSRQSGDDRMAGVELLNLGYVEIHRGNTDSAERLFAESKARRGATDPYDVAATNLSDGAVAFARGRTEEARRLLQEAVATLSGSGILLDPDDAFEVAWLSERLGISAVESKGGAEGS